MWYYSPYLAATGVATGLERLSDIVTGPFVVIGPSE